MDEKHVLFIAQEIQNQIISLTDFNVLCSWGVSQWSAIIYNGMPALRMKVNGFNTPNGYAIVALDEAEDYYKIFIQDQTGKVSMVAESIDFTQLPDVLDTAIETGSDMDAYQRFIESEKKKLIFL